MRVPFRDPLIVRNPGQTVPDPVTGNPVTGPPTDTEVNGLLLFHRSTEQAPDVATATWTALLPAGTEISSASQIIDADGRLFHVDGAVALRDNPWTHRRHLAAPLTFVSDLQTT